MKYFDKYKRYSVLPIKKVAQAEPEDSDTRMIGSFRINSINLLKGHINELNKFVGNVAGVNFKREGLNKVLKFLKELVTLSEGKTGVAAAPPSYEDFVDMTAFSGQQPGVPIDTTIAILRNVSGIPNITGAHVDQLRSMDMYL